MPATTRNARQSLGRAVVAKELPGVRRHLESITSLHTRMLTLSPAFLDAVKKVAPKKRRARMPYVMGLALLTVLVLLGLDPSFREFALHGGISVSHPAAAAERAPAPRAAIVVAKTPAPPVDEKVTFHAVEMDHSVVAPAPKVLASPTKAPLPKPHHRGKRHGGHG